MKLYEHLCQGGSYGFMSASVFLCHWKASILEVFINRSRSIDHHRITDQPWSVLYAQETDTEVMLSKRGINFSQKGGGVQGANLSKAKWLSKHIIQTSVVIDFIVLRQLTLVPKDTAYIRRPFHPDCMKKCEYLISICSIASPRGLKSETHFLAKKGLRCLA